MTQAARYERSKERQVYRSGHYKRGRTTTAGDVILSISSLKGVTFETAIIERYRRRDSSVEEALIEIGVPSRCFGTPGRGHHRGALGQQGVALHHQ